MIINIDKNNKESIKYASSQVIKVINNGGIVISPTDTVYGMLADSFNIDAVNRIYKIKEREKDKPLLILIKDIEYSEKFSYIKVPEIVKQNVPGELTFIMPLSESIKNNFLYLKSTVALRVPKDEYLEMILKYTPPLVAPSANPNGYGIILDGDKLVSMYKNKVDLIINAGIIENKIPSTLYDCLENKVIRQGNVVL